MLPDTNMIIIFVFGRTRESSNSFGIINFIPEHSQKK